MRGKGKCKPVIPTNLGGREGRGGGGGECLCVLMLYTLHLPEHSGRSSVWCVGGSAPGMSPVSLWSLSLLPPLSHFRTTAGHQVPRTPPGSSPGEGQLS